MQCHLTECLGALECYHAMQQKCRLRPNDEEQCAARNVFVTVAAPNSALSVCGINVYPLEGVLEPSVSCSMVAFHQSRSHTEQFQRLQASDTPIKPLLHPERDLGLQLIKCNEAVVRCCGSQTFRLIDWEHGAVPSEMH